MDNYSDYSNDYLANEWKYLTYRLALCVVRHG